MKLLITQEELDKLGCRGNVKCECQQCHLPFFVTKNVALRGLKGTKKVNFCSMACRSLGHQKPKNKKKCSVCNQDFESRRKSARFCSNKCANKHHGNTRRNNAKSPRVIKCLHCGQDKKYKWGTRFCSISCGQKFKKEENLKLWKQGNHPGVTNQGVIPTFIEEYIWDKYECKCAECGWNKVNPVTLKSPLHIHHIDGDSKNNKEENLKLLCPNCHALTPNFGRLNKNGTREKRYLYD